MCGIAGNYRTDNRGVDSALIVRMRDSLRHRGPDDEGIHVEQNVGLGFRRLSILDLSRLGHQPMYSPDGKCVIVFNGEIYNFIELREELKKQGHVFRSDTDTEVILASYLQYGTDCVRRFNGMWAFALWDAPARRLFCSRDRCGVKPFYYYWDEQQFVFASEIKALLEHPEVPRVENRSKAFEYVMFGYLDRDENTMFAGIKQIRPGCSLLMQNGALQTLTYWKPPEETNPGISWDDAVQGYRELFLDSVNLRMRSDVRQGLLLSGGQDSSAIAGALVHLQEENLLSARAQVRGGALSTFSSCFAQPELDERSYIEAVVDRGRFDPHYLYPSSEDILRHFGRTLWHNDEPLSTSNTLAHATLLECVKQGGIKVLLSGQGADDVLAGYDRFVVGYVVRDALMRGEFGSAFGEVRSFHRTTGFSYPYLGAQCVKSLLPRGLIPWAKLIFIERLLRYINTDALRTYRNSFASYYYQNRALTRMRAYLLSNLRHDALPMIVHYEDRGSMQYSVEERFPFLDYRLLEWTLKLPTRFLVSAGITKKVLRAAVANLLPYTVRTRTTKLGFVTPTAGWTQVLLKIPDIRNAVLAGSSWLVRSDIGRMLVEQPMPPHQSQFAWRVMNYLYWRAMFRISDRG